MFCISVRCRCVVFCISVPVLRSNVMLKKINEIFALSAALMLLLLKKLKRGEETTVKRSHCVPM